MNQDPDTPKLKPSSQTDDPSKELVLNRECMQCIQRRFSDLDGRLGLGLDEPALFPRSIFGAIFPDHEL